MVVLKVAGGWSEREGKAQNININKKRLGLHTYVQYVRTLHSYMMHVRPFEFLFIAKYRGDLSYITFRSGRGDGRQDMRCRKNEQVTWPSLVL